MIHVSTALEDRQWDAFLTQTPGGHHVQSSRWAQLKATLGWQSVRIIVSDGHAIMGGVQMLLRHISMVGTIAYIQKGPLVQSPYANTTDRLLEHILQVAHTHHTRYMVVQPPDTGQPIESTLGNHKFYPGTIHPSPTATVLIDVQQDPETMFAHMHAKTRYNIRYGLRKGVTVREGTRDDIPTLYRLLSMTGERQGFVPESQHYFEDMWDLFHSAGNLVVLLAEYHECILSAILLVAFGDRVIFKRGGWSGEHSNVHPNEVVHWAAIHWARAHGYCYYDMDGIDANIAHTVLKTGAIPPDAHKSVSRFKLGFGGEIVVLPATYARVFNPLLRWGYQNLVTPALENPAVHQVLQRLLMQ
jgi:lipid II:glycine glycyltransferase (peptidoglycan interpeptide bridge formation enzyme)